MSNQLAPKTAIVTRVSQDLSLIYYLNFYNQRPLTYVSEGVVKKKNEQ